MIRFRFAAHRVLAAALITSCAWGSGAAAAATKPIAMPLPAPPQTQRFADLSLADAIGRAIEYSPDVAGARARYEQNRHAFLAARDGLSPSLASAYTQVPQGNPPGSNIISRQLTVGLQWTIGDFLSYGAATREAALSLSAAEADTNAALATEKVKVVGLYFDALKARAIASARQSALGSAIAQRDAAQIRVDAGDAPLLDVVRADVAVAKAEADLESSTADDQNAGDALRIETNVGDARLASTVGAIFPEIDSVLTDPNAAVRLARATRPEILATQRTAQAAAIAVRGARLAGFPGLTVSGGYLVGSDSGVPVNAPSINATLTLPLSGVAHERAAIAVAKADEAQSKAVGIERQTLLDVAASSRTLGASQRAAAATTRARRSAETELRALDVGYRSGASSSLELAGARSAYAQTAVDELSALYDLEKGRARLEIEVGR